MNIRDIQRTNYCIQGQQFAARVLLTVWLLASGSPEGALATPKRQPAMVPAATTSPGDPSLASTPPTPGGQLAPDSLWGDSIASIPATDAAPQRAHGLRAKTIGNLFNRLLRPRPQAAPRTLAGPVAEGTEELPVRENALEIAQNLIDAARDEHWSDREDFLEELTQVVLATPSKMQDILDELTKAAEDPNEDVRLIVLEAFASLAPVASSAAETILPILTQAAKDEDYDTRLVALQALAKMAIAAPSEASGIMPILEAAAKDQDEDIREIALEALSMVPQTASSETTDTTTVPEDTADKQALYLENLLQLRAAHKSELPRPEPEVQQKVTFSAEAHVPQALLALQRELSELQAQKARHAQELTQLAAESVKAEPQEQKVPHTQELDTLATGKLALEPQQALHEEQKQRLSAQADAYTELLADKDSEIQKLKSALERAQRNNEALLSENEQLRSAQGKKPEASSPLSEDAVSDKAQKVPSPKIDASVWQRYFGDVGVAPPLPDNIEDVLNSPCPFWEYKQVRDTHLLVLIPSHVVGQPLTLNYLGQLIERPQGEGHATQYRYYWDGVREAIGSQISGSSYWVLMTRDVLPGSRWKSYEEQCALVERHQSYTVPGALEAAVVMLLHHVRSEDRLYTDNPVTYTRCLDKDTNGWPVIVGDFSSGGLYINYHNYDTSRNVGIAALRKFGVFPLLGDDAVSDKAQGVPSSAMPVGVPISGMSSFGLPGPAIPGGLASSATPGSLVSSFRLPGSSMPRGVASSTTPGSLVPSFVPVSAIPGGVSSPVLDASVWQRYFGDVGATPPLPDNIAAILNSPCPFWSGRQVMDTHLLVLIPAHVEGKPLTLDYLGELIQRPQGGGHATKYRYYWDGARKAIGSKASGRSYWVLMTRDVLPGSRRKSNAAQCALVADYANRTGLPYEVPGALEAAVVMLLHYARSGERLYSDSPWTYTRCRDSVVVDYKDYPVVVGGFSSGGLYVSDYNFDSSRVGVAGLRKF